MIAAIALLSASFAASTPAGGVGCSVTASGAVKAAFACTVDLRSTKDGGIVLAFTPGPLSKGVGAFLAGPFDIPGPVPPGTYTLMTLRSARMLISGPRHVSYAAETGPRARGDVTVALAEIDQSGGRLRATGTVTARLAAMSGKRGDVVVTIEFTNAAGRPTAQH